MGWHVLKKSKRVSFPHLIVVDTETMKGKDGSEKLKLGWAGIVDASEEFYFTKCGEFWEWVERHFTPEDKTLWVAAHNTDFDFRILEGFKELEKRGWDILEPVATQNPFILHFQKGKNTLWIIDSCNYTQMRSLKWVGEQLGGKKGDYQEANKAKKTLKKYCLQDVRILRKFFEGFKKFWLENDLGNFRQSMASCAKAAFLHKFMERDIWIHAHPEAQNLELKSFRGGRVEAFEIGHCHGDKFYYLDVNAMYASIMLEEEHPHKLWFYSSHGRGWEKYIGKHYLIMDALVETENNFIGIRDNKTKKLIFPVGRFRASITHPEILRLLEGGGKIIHCYNYAVYNKSNWMAPYAKFFSSKKEEYKKSGNILYEKLSKFLLNGFFGKWGQKAKYLKELGPSNQVGTFRVFDSVTQKYYTQYHFYSRAWSEEKSKLLARDSFVAISSSVTSSARCKLDYFLSKCSKENAFYCDTDSIMVNQAGHDNLKKYISDKTGMLGVKGKAGTLEVRGCKFYNFGGWTIKGLKKAKEKFLGEGVYSNLSFMRFKTALRKGNPDMVKISESPKKIFYKKYDKGIITSPVTGKGNLNVSGRVLPFRLLEEI